MIRVHFKALAVPLLPFAIVALGIAWTVSASAAAPEQYASYLNERWHYSLAVPTDMKVSEYEREGGGETVQFTDAAGNKELMISAWPYTQLDVTLGRLGEPSTMADQPDHLEIVNVLRDDVFKVLFTKNGTLYVVTTLPEYEAWLTDILTTWQFTD